MRIALLAVIVAIPLVFTFVPVSLAQQFAGNKATGPSTQEGSADIAAKIQYQQVSLEQEQSKMAVLDLNIADAEQYLDHNRAELAGANDRLEEARGRYESTLSMFDGRLSAIYKLGGDEDYSVILSSVSFSDALSRLSYLATISENDEKMVARVKIQAEEVQALQKQVDMLKQESAADLGALENQKAQLESQIETGQKNLNEATAELAQAQAREEAEAARVQAQAGSVADQMAGLEGSSPTVTLGDSQPSGLNPSGIIIAGVASWYGPGFNGQRTASGEIYNMYAYTAASRTLPFGTWLKISYDGRSVFVRINDRGPYVGGRILDLSYAAAQALGLDGIGYVTAEIYS